MIFFFTYTNHRIGKQIGYLDSYYGGNFHTIHPPITLRELLDENKLLFDSNRKVWTIEEFRSIPEVEKHLRMMNVEPILKKGDSVYEPDPDDYNDLPFGIERPTPVPKRQDEIQNFVLCEKPKVPTA